MLDWLLGKKQYHYFVTFLIFSQAQTGSGTLHIISTFPVVDWDSVQKISETVREQYPEATISSWPHLMKVDRQH